MTYLASGLAAIAEKFSDSNLMHEALAALTTADYLVIEREQPTDWAQIQLLLLKIRGQVVGVEGREYGLLKENARRARKFLRLLERRMEPTQKRMIRSYTRSSNMLITQRHLIGSESL